MQIVQPFGDFVRRQARFQHRPGTLRPVKEKKGKANRKVSGSGSGQTSEGRNPKDVARMEQAWQAGKTRREEGVRKTESNGSNRSDQKPNETWACQKPCHENFVWKQAQFGWHDATRDGNRAVADVTLLEHRRGKKPQEGHVDPA